MHAHSTTLEQIDGRAVYRKISLRLIPYLFLLYILAYLDRVNVGFAALEMRRDLSLSATVYGTGAGIFFLGSSLFDLPSNLLLGRFGPRRWITRIMVTWGVIATAMAWVHGAHSFYALRFLLGVSEAGFFPGIILYFTYWFPSRERARAVATFMTATAIAGVVGAPLSSGLLRLDGVLGLHGWQWLFIAEGVPTILMGCSVLAVLRDDPRDAPWLSEAEKIWLENELREDRKAGGADGTHRLGDAFRMPLVWLLAGIFFLDQIGIYTVNLWMPLLLHGFVHGGGTAGSVIARYATVPFVAAALSLVAVGWNSDRTGERRGHIAGCLLLAALGFAWAAYAGSLVSELCAMTLAAAGFWSIMGPFWALPTRVLGGQAAAGGVAIITMVGGIGAFLGPYLTGRLRDATAGFRVGLLGMAGLALLGAALCAALRGRGKDTPDGGTDRVT